MTPQEKALELFAEYRAMLSLPYAPLGEYKDAVAKHCAMYCTEEILSALHDEGIKEECGTRKFWYEVQAEIKKL